MPDFGNPFAPIDYGRDFNFFAKHTVSNPGFKTNCDMFITFPTYSITFQMESGTRIEYSFNGTVVHGDMIDGYASQTLTFDNRVASKIWFRGDGYVRVEAWATR